uniref:(northern house mosquito) hypothetical protein n=1 Tax=Culex pipiens TaxID=7175 RepID=A0A8D8AAR0_CULPI
MYFLFWHLHGSLTWPITLMMPPPNAWSLNGDGCNSGSDSPVSLHNQSWPIKLVFAPVSSSHFTLFHLPFTFRDTSARTFPPFFELSKILPISPSISVSVPD